MSNKTSAQIRREFLEFFKEKQHAITSSAPVVPQNDPTLLFTNAGMNQFKAIFLGEEPSYVAEGKTWQRAANTQKCIRVSGKHNDLEEVGHDTYHHTLFEMLGNWSFGDYFKQEAISWAWELLVKRWGLQPNRLYATVFGGDEKDGLPVDDEAIALWKSETSIDHSHILKFGRKDNFWEMGDTGPCGPCSEIHVDLRPDEERAKVDGASLVNTGDPRVIEIWNLVFIQFNRVADGSLKSLPAKHVDTGMGFERVCAVIQGKLSNYDSDVFTPLLKRIEQLSGITYGTAEHTDIAMRVIADHIRAVSFSIADGASPGNDGRGYVIRRILRRAIRYGWDKLGLKSPFMYQIVPNLAEQFKEVFPELKAQQAYVMNVIEAEEKGFLRTLGQGIQLFDQMIAGKTEVSGADAFKLHDTYGFPIDLTQLMAREKGVQVDTAGFDQLMKEQKERARAAGKFSVDLSELKDWNIIVKTDKPTEFVGYDTLEAEVKLTQIRKEEAGFAAIFNVSPFYAESGGQVADTGFITDGNQYIKVLDVQKSALGYIHYLDQAPERVDAHWQATVDAKRRSEIQKHHSATHLVHSALRKVLGEHVAQKGSLVGPDRLRFDFSHFKAVAASELADIQDLVNEKIQANIPLTEERNVPIEEAKKRGAMMLFGEKYGETVRVITFDPSYSVELCGGTHVKATGELGLFLFASESSVASGVRRIEAFSGASSLQHVRAEEEVLKQIRGVLGQTEHPVQDIQRLIDQRKQLEKELAAIRYTTAQQQVKQRMHDAFDVNGIRVIAAELTDVDSEHLKQLGYDALQWQPENTITVFGIRDESAGKVLLVATVTDDLVKQGRYKAGALVGQIAKLVGGGGGGQPGLATAGGKLPEKLTEALAQVRQFVASA